MHACMHRGKQALESKGRSLRSRLQAPMDQYPSVLYPSGSAHIYSFPGKLSISLPLAPYTICHVPDKSFISGRQAFSAIPWISFAGFCQKSTQLHLCLSTIRALDLQMQYYGLSPARRAKQPAIRLHQRARLSAQQITFVLLQEI